MWKCTEVKQDKADDNPEMSQFFDAKMQLHSLRQVNKYYSLVKQHKFQCRLSLL